MMVEFIMKYKCEGCGKKWKMLYVHCCDDRCPSCNMSNEPVSVKDA